REPDLEVARPGLVHHVDAGEVVLDRLAPDPRVGVGDAAELVVVVLEGVAVDRAEADAEVLGVRAELPEVVDVVQGDVQRDRRGETGEPVHGRGVGDLLLHRARGAGAAEDLEAGARVAVGPRGDLDRLALEPGSDLAAAGHGVSSSSTDCRATGTAPAAASWSSRWKISSRTRKPSSGASPSRSSKNSAISACHRAFTSVRPIAACASASDGVSTYPIRRPSSRRNSE